MLQFLQRTKRKLVQQVFNRLFHKGTFTALVPACLEANWMRSRQALVLTSERLLLFNAWLPADPGVDGGVPTSRW